MFSVSTHKHAFALWFLYGVQSLILELEFTLSKDKALQIRDKTVKKEINPSLVPPSLPL